MRQSVLPSRQPNHSLILFISLSIRLKVFSAVRWTAAAALFRIIIRLLTVAILARLLAKEDFGLMAMALVAIDFANVFADLGLNGAFMHRRNITAGERSSLFWANIFCGIFLCVMMILMSGLLSNYVYNEPRLVLVVICISPIFIINAFSAQFRVNAEKQLLFKRVTFIDLGTSLLGLVVAGAFAKLNFGVYALVLSGLSAATASALLSWKFFSSEWRPSWWFKFNELHRFIGMGGSIVASNLVSQLSTSIDILLGGKLLGAAPLGHYSVLRNMALQVNLTINPIISRVGLPVIAEVQDNFARVRGAYLKATATASAITAPMYVGLAFFSDQAVELLLGPSWADSGSLFRVLILWAAIRSLASPIASLLLGVGRANLQLMWNLCLLVVTPFALFLGYYAALQTGRCDPTTGMAYSLLVLAVLAFLPIWRFLVWPLCHISLRDYIITTLKPFGLSIIAISPAYFAFLMFSNHGLVSLTACFAWAVFNYLVISLKYNREWVGLMREFLKV